MKKSLEETISNILDEVKYRENPYFTKLHDGDFSKDDFIETQIQFFNAVIFFSRPMSALAAKIPTPELRVEVLRNVWEEHGEGDPEKVHGTTFVEFLSRLGNVTLDDIEHRSLWPEIRIFNTTLVGACVLDEYLIGVGIMGIIERMFSDISNIIGEGIMKMDWLDSKQMIHYTVHKELDIKHSQDFFKILESSWEKNTVEQYYIEQGLLLGAVLFNDLYRGLYRGRKRRWERSFSGPHSRAEGAN